MIPAVLLLAVFFADQPKTENARPSPFGPKLKHDSKSKRKKSDSDQQETRNRNKAPDPQDHEQKRSQRAN